MNRWISQKIYISQTELIQKVKKKAEIYKLSHWKYKTLLKENLKEKKDAQSLVSKAYFLSCKE